MSLRIRGVKTELEDAGLETEGMAETTAQLQAKLKALTHGKVDIMINANEFKNTTQILREMSQVWEEMTDIEQAAALELIGGKRQANILSSLISNFETVEDVIESSMNSSGSAIAENEKYLDSIQGRIDQFTNSMQTFWNNILDSNAIKGFVEFGTDVIKFLDTVPGKITAIIVALGSFVKFKGINLFNLGPDILNRINEYSRLAEQLSALKSLNLNLGSSPENWNTAGITAYANAVEGLTANEQAEILVKQGLNKAQIREIMSRTGVEDKVIQETLSKKNLTNITSTLHAATVKDVLATDMAADARQREAIASYLAANGQEKLTKARLDEMRSLNLINDEQYLQYVNKLGGSWKSLISNLSKSPGVIMMVGMAVSALIEKIKTAKEITEELSEEYDELQSSISEIDGEIDSLNSELKTIQDKIDELNKKDSLSLTDAEQLNLLKQQSEELQRQKVLQEQLLTAREKQEDAKSLQMINNMLKTTAAGQQKAAEDTAAAWKIVLGVIGAVGAVGACIAGFPTGGATWAALPTILGFATAGGLVGASIGEKAGYSYSMRSNESGDSLIEWYESYENAIAEAEQEATEAESKYMSDMTEKNHEKWQKKLDYVNTLQTEMYDGLTELQGYISNLEYDDSTSDIIDGYNDLMAYLDVKSNTGNIHAQISSIESLKDEYYALSRGVDENGNNIALSAEEYARYNSIVNQVLSYQSGLTKGFDENGNAILRAANNTYTYNQLLATSIELLKKQQQEAAKDDVDDKSIVDYYDAIVDKYKKSKSNIAYGNTPSALTVSSGKNPHGFAGGANWGTDDVAEEISYIIGVDYNFAFGNPMNYVTDNIGLIQENRDKITSQLISTMKQMGLDDTTIQNYVNQVDVWLDSVVEKVSKLTEQAKAELREKLYIVPKAKL